MRHASPLYLTVLFLTVVSHAPDARADLRVAQPVAELGRVRAGIPLSHRFTFISVGATHILDVKGSCGCLVPRLNKQSYPAGEQGVLHVELNTLTQPAGPHAWRVQVRYRTGGREGETVLLLKAELIAEILVEPTAIVLFIDRPLQREILIKDLRPRPFLITKAQASSPAIRAQVDTPTRDPEGRWTCKVLLNVTPDGPDGRRDEILSIYTDDPEYRELRVPITLVKRTGKDVTATPASLSISVERGLPIPSQRILVRSRDGRPVSIERVDVNERFFKVSWSQGEHPTATVRIAVDKGVVEGGEFITVLHVHIDKPTRDVIAVPVTVRVP